MKRNEVLARGTAVLICLAAAAGLGACGKKGDLKESVRASLAVQETPDMEIHEGVKLDFDEAQATTEELAEDPIPVIFAAETEAAREELRAFMRQAKAGTLTESDLRQMTELVLAYGVERTRQEIHRLFRKSIALLDTLENNESNDRIRELIGKIDAV